jgi:hemerythrin superfamily protein
LVFPHAFAEEAVLWPTMRKVLPDGDQLTLAVEKEHQLINELVARLDETPPTDPSRPELIRQIVDWLREDVRDEEDVLLPRLQQALSERELRRLGMLWELFRRTSPTRAHPVVSRRPPGQTLSALPLTVLDRSRDALDLGARHSERWRPTLDRASALLGRGARRTERARLFRIGERAETHLE